MAIDDLGGNISCNHLILGTGYFHSNYSSDLIPSPNPGKRFLILSLSYHDSNAMSINIVALSCLTQNYFDSFNLRETISTSGKDCQNLVYMIQFIIVSSCC